MSLFKGHICACKWLLEVHSLGSLPMVCNALLGPGGGDSCGEPEDGGLCSATTASSVPKATGAQGTDSTRID